MFKQIIAVAFALMAMGCAGSLVFSLFIVMTRFVFDLRVLMIMVSLTGGMIVAAWLSRFFYRMAIQNGSFPPTRMIGIAIVLLVIGLVVTLFYSWIFAPFIAFADRKPLMALGAVLLVVPCVLAYPVNYFLNVRHTTQSGVVNVNSFLGYMGHGIASLLAHIILGGSALIGMFIVLAVGLFG